jgi:lysophospholipase L1-like esterase
MLDTELKSADQTTIAPLRHPNASRVPFVLLVLSILLVVFNRVYIPNIHYDWLNFIPALATIYIGYAVVALRRTCGHIDYVARSLSEDKAVPKPFGSSLFSPYFRSMLLMALLLVVAEFGLRCASYHRALLYERQGDLLYTPVPNQQYVEKISLTHSQINDLGLRGAAVDTTGKRIVLCLGDSVTYGYGVDDNHTYPAELQSALDRAYPGRFAVVNGGVDGYPIPFMREKFLYLWNLGVHPDLVIVGYSFNEGGLGHLVDSDAKTKDKFAAAVRFKNHVRSIALYNLIVENWARHSYDKMKKYMVPGTNFKTLSKEDVEVRYQKSLQDFYDDLTARQVKPVFLLFTGFDGRTGVYDTKGPFQIQFGDFAETHGIALLRSNQALVDQQSPATEIQKYFLDQVHMNEAGTLRVGQGIAAFLSSISHHPSPAQTSRNQ